MSENKCPKCDNLLSLSEEEFGIEENEFGEIVESNLWKCDSCEMHYTVS